MSNPPPQVVNQQFQEALAKARMVAEKIRQQTGGAPGKRPLDEDDDSPGGKRSYSSSGIQSEVATKIHDLRQQFSSNFTSGGGGMSSSSGDAIPKLGEKPLLEGIVLNGEKTQDMMIPGSKVGYIIGKGGEMIRNLQDRAGVKMTIYQTSNMTTETDKQLRIVGPPDKVDYCRQLVSDLLTEKEMETMKVRTNHVTGGMGGMGSSGGGGSSFGSGGPSRGGHNDYGSMRGGPAVEVAVPPNFIGLVIGKGGESIKRIQAETGTKIQFDTTKSDSKGNKICAISGTPDSIRRAQDMIQEIIDNAGNNRRAHDPSRSMPHGGEEVRYPVPANRCGAVIGRGGETIRQIKQQSGCDIELDKMSKAMGGDEKVFIIRGPSDRIPYAQQLINEKVRGTNQSASPPRDSNAFGAQSGDYSWSNYAQAEYGLAPSVPQEASGENAAAWAAYYAQYYAQAGATSTGSQPPQPGQPPSGGPPGVPGGAPPSNGSQSAPGAAGGEQDYSSQWAEYYRAYGMFKEAEQIEQMAKTQRGAGQSSSGNPYPKAEGNSSQNSSGGSSVPTPIGYPNFNYGSYGQSSNNGSEKQERN